MTGWSVDGGVIGEGVTRWSIGDGVTGGGVGRWSIDGAWKRSDHAMGEGTVQLMKLRNSI